MCRECRRVFCPARCPNYNGYSASRGRPHGVCGLCGHPFYQYDTVYPHGRLRLCEDCHRLRLETEEMSEYEELQSLPSGIGL